MTSSAPGLVLLVTTLTPEEEARISPGLVGFLVTFAVVLVTVLLLLDLTRRLRRMRHRQDVAERRAQQEATDAGARAAVPEPQAHSGSGDGPPPRRSDDERPPP